MKSTLFISLSTIALVGVSVVTHAAMIKYMDGDINHVPQGDCLEMMCDYGCVEDQGTFIGHCCPSAGSNNQACNPGGVNIGECCQQDKGLVCSAGGSCACTEGTEWNGTQCVKCSFGGVEYAKNAPVGECGYCEVPKTNSISVQNPNPCAGRSDGKTYCDINTWTCVCPPGVVLGCDGVCGSGKVVGCDGVCGSGKEHRSVLRQKIHRAARDAESDHQELILPGAAEPAERGFFFSP